MIRGEGLLIPGSEVVPGEEVILGVSQIETFLNRGDVRCEAGAESIVVFVSKTRLIEENTAPIEEAVENANGLLIHSDSDH